MLLVHLLFLGEGLLYVTPNQEKIIAKRENRIESYQVDSQQLEFSVNTDKGSISCYAISDSYFVFSIKQKTGKFSTLESPATSCVLTYCFSAPTHQIFVFGFLYPIATTHLCSPRS